VDGSAVRTDVPKPRSQDRTYRVIAAAAILLLAAGTVSFRLLEGWSWVDSLYFCTIAVTTVGFGDLVPTTDSSKLFTIIYVFGGVGIITTFLNARLRHHANRVAENAGN
jgi:hypothetical protein